MTDASPLKVILAGFNLDRDTLDELIGAAYEQDSEPPVRDSITPETISAAYARISRNPAEVPQLRSMARKEVEKARRSNQKIIFGLGHASVAEHAVFNFDVVGISRLAVEAVEHHRLASFTEKSQRYIRLDGDFVLPAEIRETGLGNEFKDLIEFQNDTYHKLYPVLRNHFTREYAAEGRDKPENLARGRASEDARYVVSLATQAQLGMTINARTLEIMTRSCTAHPLNEVRDFGRMLASSVEGIAPSLVKYVSSTPYEVSIARRTAWWMNNGRMTRDLDTDSKSDVKLIHADEDGEAQVLAGLLFRRDGTGLEQAMANVEGMSLEQRMELIRDTLEHNAPWDPPPRDFELAGFTFEIEISATAFAQLKRHRMATLISGPYDPSLGWITPDSIIAINRQKQFDEVMKRSAEFAGKCSRTCQAAAPYALTNANKRRVIFHANARELQHVSRLREDLHAQWDIRRIASKMIRLAREKAPALMLLSAGKHEFEKRRNEVYGEKPIKDHKDD